MTRDEMIEFASRDCKSTLGNVVLLFFFGMVSSLFVWIWHSGDLAIKVFITSLICYLISMALYQIALKVIVEEVDKIIAGRVSKAEKKSKFHQRLEDFQQRNNE